MNFATLFLTKTKRFPFIVIDLVHFLIAPGHINLFHSIIFYVTLRQSAQK